MTNHHIDSIDKYISENNLDQVIDFNANAEYQKQATDTISGKLTIPFPPEKSDLVRLHKLIRTRKPFTILEFGVGYSTAIMADALEKNYQEWQKLTNKPVLRNRFAFQIFSVDASKRWIKYTEKHLPTHLKTRVNFSYSTISIGLFRDQLCHYYDQLPDIVPDFIYLDAPDTKQVKGQVRGMSFQCQERTVMAADILTMESTLLPGTLVLVDGRSNNARFLARNFSRPFKVKWDAKNDVTTMELKEEPLGEYNVIGAEVY